MHLFLSPHLDDIVLSCGGLIVELLQQGERVEVMTFFAADAPKPLPDSPLIDNIHQRWGLGDNPFLERREEDKRAFQALGSVKPHFGDWQDCIYRLGKSGQPLYVTDDHIFGTIHPEDPLRSTDIDLTLWQDELTHLYIPLGAGNHVDHQLLRQKANMWIEKVSTTVAVFWYEEYPYSSEAGEVNVSHSGEEARLSGVTAVKTALSWSPFDVVSQVYAISEDALHAKIEAIKCHYSQISTFWHSDHELAESVLNYARSVGQSSGVMYGERLWKIKT
jgi:LmbE family N-acetylglucosaminyl deacetylase